VGREGRAALDARLDFEDGDWEVGSRAGAGLGI
jgi:hypothetical protein